VSARHRSTAYVRGLAILLLGLVTLMTGGLTGAGAAAPLMTLRVALTPLQSWAPLFIADKEGFFAEQGIKVEWVPFASGAEAIAVLSQGQLDVGVGGISAAFFNAAARGDRVRIVADQGHIAPGAKNPALMIRRDFAGGVVKGVADLKGRRVGLNATGGLAHYLLTKALATVGLRPGDMDVQRMPFPAIFAALQNRAIDAGVLSEPFVIQAIEAGIAVPLVTAGQVIPTEAVSFIYYGPNLMEKDPALGRRFMTAYVKGLRQYGQGANEKNVAIIAEYTKTDPALLRRMEWYAMHRDGHVDVNGIRRFQDWLYEYEFINLRVPVATLVDTRFLDAANAALGNR